MRASVLLAEGCQNIFHPDIIFAAGIDKQAAVLDHLDVLGRRLIGVDLLAGLEQHIYVRFVTRDLPGKIILGKDCRDDLQTGFCLSSFPAGNLTGDISAASGKHQGEEQKGADRLAE